jgi:hypothetical protein
MVLTDTLNSRDTIQTKPATAMKYTPYAHRSVVNTGRQ